MDTMQRMLKTAVVLLLAVLATPVNMQGAPGTGKVVVCPLDWMVDDAMVVVVKRAVREAKGAAALVFEIDTPGGRVDSAIDITNTIMGASCPTIAHVKGMGAISAGALISYSCKNIVMAPGTNIGASAPIMMGMEQVPQDVDEKTKSFLRSRYRALGEENGHDPLLGEAMVDDRIEIHGRKDEAGRYSFIKINKVEAPQPSATPDQTPGLPISLDPMEEAIKNAAEKVAKELIGAKPLPKNLPLADDDTSEPRLLPDGSEMVCAAGELLTLTTNEALRYGLIPLKATTLDEALAHFGYEKAPRENIERTWSEKLFSWLTSPLISGLLLMIGVAGIYIEFKTPGFGAPGIIGITCLALLLGSYLMIGLADWIDLLLVLAGLILLVVEIFFIPSFGAAGVAGGVCLILGLYLSLTRVPIPQYAWDYDRLADAGQTMAVGVSLFAVFVLATWKLFPKTPFYHWVVLTTTQQPDQGYIVQTAEQQTSAVGLKGVAATMLRPAGRGRFGDTTFDIVTRGEFIEPGTPVEIIEADGNRYVVKAIG